MDRLQPAAALLERGHAAADYTTLLHWWNEHNFGQHLYIGQDLKRSIDKNELEVKISQTREMSFRARKLLLVRLSGIGQLRGVTGDEGRPPQGTCPDSRMPYA